MLRVVSYQDDVNRVNQMRDPLADGLHPFEKFATTEAAVLDLCDVRYGSMTSKGSSVEQPAAASRHAVMHSLLSKRFRAIQNLESRIQHPDPRLQNPESRTQNPESRIQNLEPKKQNPDPNITPTGFA